MHFVLNGTKLKTIVKQDLNQNHKTLYNKNIFSMNQGHTIKQLLKGQTCIYITIIITTVMITTLFITSSTFY